MFVKTFWWRESVPASYTEGSLFMAGWGHSALPQFSNSAVLRTIGPTTTFLLTAALLGFGCASTNVNPAAPRKNAGYVDLYSNPSGQFSWKVERFDPGANRFKKVFNDVQPMEHGILRLEFTPGHHKIQVTFLNRAVIESAAFDVEVREGEVTPVQVKLLEAGIGSVQTKSTSAGATAYGRYGRSTKIGSYEASMYRISALPEPIQPYKPKQQMSYGH